MVLPGQSIRMPQDILSGGGASILVAVEDGALISSNRCIRCELAVGPVPRRDTRVHICASSRATTAAAGCGKDLPDSMSA